MEFMTGDVNILKLDQDLNILIEYYAINTAHIGISYNPSNGLLYVEAYWLKEIQVFNLNLTLIRRET